jgi:hypothetical protein
MINKHRELLPLRLRAFARNQKHMISRQARQARQGEMIALSHTQHAQEH